MLTLTPQHHKFPTSNHSPVIFRFVHTFRASLTLVQFPIHLAPAKLPLLEGRRLFAIYLVPIIYLSFLLHQRSVFVSCSAMTSPAIPDAGEYEVSVQSPRAPRDRALPIYDNHGNVSENHPASILQEFLLKQPLFRWVEELKDRVSLVWGL